MPLLVQAKTVPAEKLLFSDIFDNLSKWNRFESAGTAGLCGYIELNPKFASAGKNCAELYAVPNYGAVALRLRHQAPLDVLSHKLRLELDILALSKYGKSVAPHYIWITLGVLHSKVELLGSLRFFPALKRIQYYDETATWVTLTDALNFTTAQPYRDEYWQNLIAYERMFGWHRLDFEVDLDKKIYTKLVWDDTRWSGIEGKGIYEDTTPAEAYEMFGNLKVDLGSMSPSGTDPSRLFIDNFKLWQVFK